MSDSGFQAINEWFLKLADISDQEQAEELSKIEQQSLLDAEQIILLKSMLQADQGEQSLPENIQEITTSWHQEEASFQMNETPKLGNYRLQKPLGTGGMGHVYLAARDDGSYQKQVAIKISQFQVKASMVKRFENERQILAKLNHPNIAQLLDGGTAEDGRPYLVMEYVAGQDIAQYCIDRKLGLRARLRLILQICEAVSYAHQQLVLHRDLKPNNIMVNEQNQIKLLDFGIGKLLDEDRELTQTATQIMTRSYASPEQIKGELVTTASDLFSLAVVTYELLTGFHPYPHQSGLERDQNVVSGQIRKFTKETGKTRAIYPKLATIANEKLKGDLENILHKALSPLAKDRYPSVEAFAEDIRHYLHNRPIMARKPSPWYSFKKMVQRHSGVFTVTLIAFVMMVILTLFALIQAQKASEQADLANQEANKARMTTAFLTDLLTKAKPTNNSQALTVNELLENAYTDLQQDEDLEAGLRFELLDVVYRSMMSLSMYEQTLATIETDYQSCVDALGESKNTCQNLLIGQFMIHNNNNESEKAVPILEKAEAISLAKDPLDNKELLFIYDANVIINTDLNQPKKAIDYAEKALNIRKADPSFKADALRVGHNNLALSLILDGQMDRAKAVMADIPEYLAMLTDPDRRAMGQEKLHNLWAFYHSQNKDSFKAAEERLLAQQALSQHFEAYSSSMLWTFRVAASELLKAARFSEAQALYRETLSYLLPIANEKAFDLQRVYADMALLAMIIGDESAITLHLHDFSQIERPIKAGSYMDDMIYWVKTWQTIGNMSSDWETLWQGLPNQLLNDEGELSELSQCYVSLTKAWVAIQTNDYEQANQAISQAETYWQKYPNHYLHVKFLAERLKKITGS